MKRVKKGERYWFITDRFVVCFFLEDNSPISNKHFETNNYFHTKEEAESMAEKIRKVLKGADVIEMPSEEEIHEIAELDEISYVMHNSHKPQSRDEWFRIGFKRGINWLKSKIVK